MSYKNFSNFYHHKDDLRISAERNFFAKFYNKGPCLGVGGVACFCCVLGFGLGCCGVGAVGFGFSVWGLQYMGFPVVTKP